MFLYLYVFFRKQQELEIDYEHELESTKDETLDSCPDSFDDGKFEIAQSLFPLYI